MTGRHHPRSDVSAWLLVAILSAGVAHAQTPAAPLSCPAEIGSAHLYGQWQLTLRPAHGQHTEAPLRLERHPDYAETVRGEWTAPSGQVHLLSGDISEGELVLDESVDGVNISAVWAGYPVDCGRGFEGERRPSAGSDTDTDNPSLRQRFVLRRAGGWH